MAENEPPESEIVLDSRKAKVVALFAAAPSAASLCYLLYRLARRFDLLPGSFVGTEDAGARIDALGLYVIAVVLAFPVILLYLAFKIWLRPTVENLRRVPFIAAFWCFMGVLFGAYPLFREESELLKALGSLLAYSLMLGGYVLVKNAMVLWFKTPELAHSGLQNISRNTLWWYYCFGLWGTLMRLAFVLVEDTEFPFIIDKDIVWLPALIISFIGATYFSVYVYKKGPPNGIRQ